MRRDGPPPRMMKPGPGPGDFDRQGPPRPPPDEE